MQAFLEQGQGVMRVGKDVGFARQVSRGLGKAGQHILEQQLETLLGQRQAGRQRDNLVLHLRIEAAECAPSRLRNGATAG
jgi:hypothetical protein